MRFIRFLGFISLLFMHKAVLAHLSPEVTLSITGPVTIALPQELSIQELTITEDKRPNPLLVAFRKKHSKNKKVVAAILAFPFPFGIVGLHRIYLGCSPYVPVIYIATAGGVLGILPFIDFCVLLLDKDVDRYINNKKVFMWVN